MDTYSMHQRPHRRPASSPASRSRSAARRAATRPPAAACSSPRREALRAAGHRPRRRATVAVQGFGNVGSRRRASCSHEHRREDRRRQRRHGGIYNRDGLDIAALCAYKSKRAAASPTSRAPRRSPTRELLELAVRHPRSPPRSRARSPPQNAARMQCQAHRRGRQRPDHARGRRRSCASASIFVVPDILANAGGVTVTYFEWVQDLQRASSGPRTRSTSAWRRRSCAATARCARSP